MTAYQLASHALDNVLENLKAALKMSLPVLVLVILGFAVFMFPVWKLLLEGNIVAANTTFKSGGWIGFMIAGLFMVFAMYWVTVSWHRFVLLKEAQTSLLPKLIVGPIWGYMWRVLVLAFVIGLVLIIPMLMLSAFGLPVSVKIGDYSQAIYRGPTAIIINFVATVFFVYAFLRYAPFLVATAIERPISARDAREFTYKGRWNIFLIAVGYAVMTLLNSFIGTGLAIGIWQIELAIFLMITWVSFMFSISMITILYQEYIEHATIRHDGQRVSDGEA